jgi:hypothetical protein
LEPSSWVGWEASVLLLTGEAANDAEENAVSRQSVVAMK